MQARFAFTGTGREATTQCYRPAVPNVDFSGRLFEAITNTADGTDQYIRFHNDGNRSTGFMLMWASNAARDIHIERVATLISASLWADQTDAASSIRRARRQAPTLLVFPMSRPGTYTISHATAEHQRSKP